MKVLITLTLLFSIEANAQKYRKLPPLDVARDTSYIITGGLPGISIKKTDKQKKMDGLLIPNRPNALIFTSEEFSKMPISDIRDLQVFAPGIYQRRRGEDAFPVGGRPGEIEYVIDGIRLLN